ncbi:MAG: N-acetylmuramoyl-L-alanine amidase [Candidatus Solibacter usitatus]|nr:N-acetylmuramoyl-L-alanine amidase [Candidatus Solibacter usitatus]
MKRTLRATALVLACAALAPAARRTGGLEVTAVRFWSLDGATRIAIEVSGECRYRAERIQDPDRIFFDLIGARPSIKGKRVHSAEIGDKLVKRIRVAETQPDVTRVVLDLEAGVDFTVSQLANPDRVMIELRPVNSRLSDSLATVFAPAPVAPPAAPPVAPPVTAAPAATRPRVAALTATPAAKAGTKLKMVLSSPPSIRPNTPRLNIARLTTKPVFGPAPPPVAGSSPTVAQTMPQTTPPPAPQTMPSAPPKAARRTADGTSSLTRALGLKVNRVVLDAGHGGPDQGTLGKRGLTEKDLVLDVTLRLGKLIEERMGSEVIYTRTDDTFIPLHARTELANQKKADLFLSIHANSSPYPKIGGVETYYLNLTRSPEALDVAARENASSEKSIFELRELIQSITLHDKVEESKEFAGRVQTALQSFETRTTGAAKNRGIKKAPFVVLIGASMPSILAEIGFLSNSKEEALLKKPDHRQKLAEALYQGVSQYARTLSHFQVAQRTGASE